MSAKLLVPSELLHAAFSFCVTFQLSWLIIAPAALAQVTHSVSVYPDAIFYLAVSPKVEGLIWTFEPPYEEEQPFYLIEQDVKEPQTAELGLVKSLELEVNGDRASKSPVSL